YWIYDPSYRPWPDSIECEHSSGRDPFTVSRAERPLGAPGTLTENGQEYQCFGVLRRDRDEEAVLLCPAGRPLGQPEESCPAADFLITPSRAPLWFLLRAVAAGVVSRLAVVIIVVVAGVRHRPSGARRPSPGAAPPPPAPAASRT